MLFLNSFIEQNHCIQNINTNLPPTNDKISVEQSTIKTNGSIQFYDTITEENDESLKRKSSLDTTQGILFNIVQNW